MSHAHKWSVPVIDLEDFERQVLVWKILLGNPGFDAKSRFQEISLLESIGNPHRNVSIQTVLNPLRCEWPYDIIAYDFSLLSAHRISLHVCFSPSRCLSLQY